MMSKVYSEVERRKIDRLISLKVYAIESGAYDLYRVNRRAIEDGSYDRIGHFIQKYGYDTLKVCRNLYHSRQQKFQRVVKRVSPIVYSKEGYFLTLTFRDDVLNKNTSASIRRYVGRFLKANFDSYVANPDYGDAHQRLHYHAVVHCPTWPMICAWKKDYGFYLVEKIRVGSSSLDAISKYISKLTNHAIKASTSGSRCIYSREKRDEPPSWLFWEYL